jgi:hypothetical protein
MIVLWLLVAPPAEAPLACGSAATYYPANGRWAVAGGDTVVFRFAGAEPVASAFDSIAAAFALWNGVDCGGSPPRLQTTRGAPHPTEGSGGDENVIYFKNDVWADAGALAYTHTAFSDFDTWIMVSADMEFNGHDYRWRTDSGGCASGSDCYDLFDVALHEAGHFNGFFHVECTDAVMHGSGDPSRARRSLSVHETTGMCALYPPRADNFGAPCGADAECDSGTCMLANAPQFGGVCTFSCTDHSDCPPAFECGPKGCVPGALGGVLAATDCACDQTTNCEDGCACDGDCAEDPPCTPCTGSAQCASGFCAMESAGDSTGICTHTCRDDEGCGDGFSCRATAAGWNVCWPDGGTASCASGGQALGEDCYGEDERGNVTRYQPCGPGLVCFVFQPDCELPSGKCVLGCDASGVCPQGLTCCYGLDEDRHCVAAPGNVGACFNLRAEGQTCTQGENSVCETGLGCFSADGDQARCYDLCAGGCASSRAACYPVASACASYELCCDVQVASSEDRCIPGEAPVLYDLGVACDKNGVCSSGLCYSHEGEQACSRSCAPANAYGCPGPATDVNDDGKPDGGFDCLPEGYCWPRRGPIGHPGARAALQAESGGCCSATPSSPADWLLLLVLLRRARRRQ